MEIVLVHPEIPHNTGCAGRLAAALGLRLHLVEPLGFSLDDRYLKRAGLDYWPMIDLVVHGSLDAALATLGRPARSARAPDPAAPPEMGRSTASLAPDPRPPRLRLFTARGGSSLFEADFTPDDVLVFGSESKGLPPTLLDAHPDDRVYLPIRPGIRSLNLANVVAVAVYTALDRAGVPLPDNDGTYVPHPDAERDVWPSERVGGDGGSYGCE